MYRMCRGRNLAPDPICPETREKQQVFVTACKQDLKFLPISVAERDLDSDLVVVCAIAKKMGRAVNAE